MLLLLMLPLVYWSVFSLSDFDKFAVITLVCVNLLTGYGHEGLVEQRVSERQLKRGIDLMDFR